MLFDHRDEKFSLPVTVDDIESYLTTSHLDYRGGYPYDYFIWGGGMWVAELDAGKDYAATSLAFYSDGYLLEWKEAANAWFKEAMSEGDTDFTLQDIEEAIGDSQPEACRNKRPWDRQ